MLDLQDPYKHLDPYKRDAWFVNDAHWKWYLGKLPPKPAYSDALKQKKKSPTHDPRHDPRRSPTHDPGHKQDKSPRHKQDKSPRHKQDKSPRHKQEPSLGKTKFCKYKLQNKCSNRRCTFAHTMEEFNPIKCSYGLDCSHKSCTFIHPSETIIQYFNRIYR